MAYSHRTRHLVLAAFCETSLSVLLIGKSHFISQTSRHTNSYERFEMVGILEANRGSWFALFVCGSFCVVCLGRATGVELGVLLTVCLSVCNHWLDEIANRSC